jgi:hypothetical protein
MTQDHIIDNCKKIIAMYEQGLLGNYEPTESIAPDFATNEERLVYYTLPMALNYRRPSVQLWNAAKATWLDPNTKVCFDLRRTTLPDELTQLLSIYKLSMQPTRHPLIWRKIVAVLHDEWGSVEQLLESVQFDFLKLRDIVQITYKKQFPYLSGPKLFNFWCYILGVYCHVEFKNKEYIDIAVDSHIRRASGILRVISEYEQEHFDAYAIAARWRKLLKDSDIAPVDLNVPLWFWSRSNFLYSDTLI